MRLVLRLLKGIYDVLASYLLAWVLLFAFVGWLLYLLVGLLLPFWGFQTHEGLWLWCDRAFPLPSWLLRLLLFGAIHVGLYFSLRRPIRGLRRRAGRRIDAWLDRYRAWAKRRRRVATTLGVSFSLLVTLLLVPFVVQPTMVPARFSARDWALRLANLVDGSASAALIESVIGFYRRFGARPTLGESVSPEAFDRAIAGRSVPRASGTSCRSRSRCATPGRVSPPT